MKLTPIIAAAAFVATAPAHAGWEANLPDPISADSLDDKPYRYVGRLSKGCSGTVVKHDRVVLTAAHCFYNDDGDFTGVGSWWPRLHASAEPDTGDAIPLYGHRRFNNYVSYLSGSGKRNDKEAFNHDIATAFGFQDLAYGQAAPYYTDGADALKSGKDKRIVGYPTSLYSSSGSSPRQTPANEHNKYKMHSTNTVGHRFYKRTGTSHFYRANGRAKWDAKLVSAPGNSGGPVYVKDSNGVWGIAGVFVSVINDYNIGNDKSSGRGGARALNNNVIDDLIDPLADAGDCNFSISPLSRSHSHTGGNGSIAVSAGEGCAWAASADQYWISFEDTGDGTGSDTVTYKVAGNPGAGTRTATVTLGGESFNVHQLGHETRELYDRSPSYHSLSHEERSAGQSLTIRADVTNFGNSASGSFNVAFYASTNTTISTNDIYLGQKTVTSIAGLSSRAIDKTVVLPEDISGDTYHIGWVIDTADAVAEENETNNRVVHADTLFVREIDLHDDGSISHAISKSSVVGGEIMEIEGDVKNSGNAGSGGFKVMFFASKISSGGGTILSNGGTSAPKIDPGDVYLGTRSVGSIPAGHFAPLNKTVTIPVGLATGSYRIKWAIDATGKVAETDEGNNIVAASNSNFTVKKTIDLRDRGVPYQWVSHTARKPGDAFTVSAQVKNAGNTGAGSFKVRFYLSDDAVINSGDTLLGETTVASLAAGAQKSVGIGAHVPLAMSGGHYRIGWKIDPEETSTTTSGNVLILPGGTPPASPAIEKSWNNTVLHPVSLRVETPGFTFDPGGPDPWTPTDLKPNPGPVDPEPPVASVTILEIHRTPGSFAIEFATQDGLRYTLQESTDGKVWKNLSSISGSGAPKTLSDEDAGDPSCLYRVKADVDLVISRLN